MESEVGLILSRRDINGLVLSEEVFTPGAGLPFHTHESASLCIALQGSCTELFRNENHRHIVSGFHFLVPDNLHSLKVHDEGLRCLTVDISAELMESAREYSLVLDSSVHAHGGVAAGLLMKLYREFRQADAASSIAIVGLTFETLAEVSRRQLKPERNKQQRWLNQAREFLQAHFNEPVSLLMVAQAVGVHPVHVAREFRRNYNCTVGEYLRKLRIEHACRQLSEQEFSLSQISIGAGFSDQSHFGRTFKRLVGMTPAEYRQCL